MGMGCSDFSVLWLISDGFGLVLISQVWCSLLALYFQKRKNCCKVGFGFDFRDFRGLRLGLAPSGQDFRDSLQGEVLGLIGNLIWV